MRGRLPKHDRLRRSRRKASTRAVLPSEAESAGRDVPELPDRLGIPHWPLRMRPETYIGRHPQGDYAEQARKVIAGARWHPEVLRWWVAVWRSPMAAEYIEADRNGLELIAELRQRFLEAQSASERVTLAKEIRLWSERFGLSPIDRKRLQWTIERAERASEKRRRRGPDPRKDPREVLKSI